MQIPNEGFENYRLLNVFLTEICSFWLNYIKQLRDNGGDSSEEMRPRNSFELI